MTADKDEAYKRAQRHLDDMYHHLRHASYALKELGEDVALEHLGYAESILTHIMWCVEKHRVNEIRMNKEEEE